MPSKAPLMNRDEVKEEIARRKKKAPSKKLVRLSIQYLLQLGYPKRYLDAKVSSLPKWAKSNMTSFLEELPSHCEKGEGILFYDPTSSSSGPSAIAIIVKCAVARGMTAMYTSELEVHDALSAKYAGDASRMDALIEPKILAIDATVDVDKNKLTAALPYVVTERYRALKPTLIATRLDAPRLVSFYGASFAQVISDCCYILAEADYV